MGDIYTYKHHTGKGGKEVVGSRGYSSGVFSYICKVHSKKRQEIRRTAPTMCFTFFFSPLFLKRNRRRQASIITDLGSDGPGQYKDIDPCRYKV